MDQEEVTLWRTGAQSKPARLSLVGDEVIPARCETAVMARLEAPLGTNFLTEPTQKSSREEEPMVWAAAIDDQKPEPRKKQGLCKQRADGKRVRRVAAATANGWDQQALRREQLADNYVGPLLRQMEAGQCPKWRDVSDWGPIYKSYWAQWKSHAVRDGVQQCH
jgi:hypothetical protein